MLDLTKFLLFDGAMGTMLQNRGLRTGELPERFNLTNPDAVLSVHEEYVKAGADVVTTNTFGANRFKLTEKGEVEKVIFAAVNNAKKSGAKFVALDIGPTGKLLKPLGTLSFDEAYDVFREQVIAGENAGADLIIIETMSDLLEAKAALLAAKENSALPVFVTMTFSSDGRTFLGTEPKTAAITLSSLGADAVGINCSLAPAEIAEFAKEIAEYSSAPVIVQANAGLPKIEGEHAVYTLSPDKYAADVEKILDFGVSIIGGCCGTTPAHIKELRALIDRRKTPEKREVKSFSALTGVQKTVFLDSHIAVIGERINPTGKKKLKEALKNKDYDYIINEAINQENAGADILDVNAGLPEICEKEVLAELVTKLQAVTSLPLQIDSSDPEAVEAAVRVYCGKPIINSVNGKEETLAAILPIVKKYGASVVALTLDEAGIPTTAEGRFEIAKKIYGRAADMGIPKEDIFVDGLVMSVSAEQNSALETIKTISLVKNRLGLKTVLGVSNISFGLPRREIVNSAFLSAALGAGLDMPILNPLSEEYMNVISAFRVLSGEDKNSVKYIEKYSATASADSAVKAASAGKLSLRDIILEGRKSMAADAVKDLLGAESTEEIINNHFIPALDEVGAKYERGEMFLPQLIGSAEAVKCGFDVLREREAASNKAGNSRGKIVLATVKGDIHDIGKNIVKMLLENYGYSVIDLGKDVPPELVLKTVKENGVRLVGLSALMTTTVKSMADTIALLRENGADCKIMVGGAVLTEEYARLVGADFYAKDAAASAKIAGEFFGE